MEGKMKQRKKILSFLFLALIFIFGVVSASGQIITDSFDNAGLNPYSGNPKIGAEELSIESGKTISFGGVDWLKITFNEAESCVDKSNCIATAYIYVKIKDKTFKAKIKEKP